MKLLKRFFFILSLGLLYLVVREFLELYYYLSNIHSTLAYLFLLLVLLILGYFLIIPLFQIFKLPKNPGPTQNKSFENKLIHKRLKLFQSNPKLSEFNSKLDIALDPKLRYAETIKYLEKECDLIRQKKVANLFYSSAFVQNGFVDAILILSASINLVKEIFRLYNGRVSNRDLMVIAKHTYYSIAIGGSEVAEYTTEELFSKLSSESLQAIPFGGKIISSIVDGFVNATLLTRVGLITENYCKLTYIENNKILYPKFKSVFEATKHITGDLGNKILNATIMRFKEKVTGIIKPKK